MLSKLIRPLCCAVVLGTLAGTFAPRALAASTQSYALESEGLSSGAPFQADQTRPAESASAIWDRILRAGPAGGAERPVTAERLVRSGEYVFAVGIARAEGLSNQPMEGSEPMEARLRAMHLLLMCLMPEAEVAARVAPQLVGPITDQLKAASQKQTLRRVEEIGSAPLENGWQVTLAVPGVEFESHLLTVTDLAPAILEGLKQDAAWLDPGLILELNEPGLNEAAWNVLVNRMTRRYGVTVGRALTRITDSSPGHNEGLFWESRHAVDHDAASLGALDSEELWPLLALHPADERIRVAIAHQMASKGFPRTASRISGSPIKGDALGLPIDLALTGKLEASRPELGVILSVPAFTEILFAQGISSPVRADASAPRSSELGLSEFAAWTALHGSLSQRQDSLAALVNSRLAFSTPATLALIASVLLDHNAPVTAYAIALRSLRLEPSAPALHLVLLALEPLQRPALAHAVAARFPTETATLLGDSLRSVAVRRVLGR